MRRPMGMRSNVGRGGAAGWLGSRLCAPPAEWSSASRSVRLGAALRSEDSAPLRPQPPNEAQPPRERRGSVLLVVLVVVLLLSLGAYTFSELMVSELEAVTAAGRTVQVRTAAQSGVEYAAGILGNRLSLTEENLYHDPLVFQAQPIAFANDTLSPARFSIIAPVETDPRSQQVRFGLIDESGRINLNVLAQRSGEALPEVDESVFNDYDPSAAEGSSAAAAAPAIDPGVSALMPLPYMTEDIADAILDFLDSDEVIRQYGAESEFYTTLSPPYTPKNGPLESLDELLLVRGVTPWLLFGEDANRNGILDPNENDGEATPPMDDGDGILYPGWAAYLTIHSREVNMRADGTPRINLNQSLLTELYDQLEPEFGEDIARFIVAYRINGAIDPNAEESDDGEGGRSGESGASRGSDSGDGGSSDSGSGEDEEALRQMAQSLARSVAQGEGGQIHRGGMDLSQGGSNQIESLYSLVGVQVQAEIDGVRTTLDSPWSLENLDTEMPVLIDALSTTDAEFIEGRININQARLETLLGIPEMPEELAYDIVGQQMVGSGGEPLADQISGRATTAWLVTQGLTDLVTLRKLDPYITARGDVYRAQVIGHLDAGGPVCRIEAVIDATQMPPKVVFLRDLTDLGRGYSRQHYQLTVPTGP